MTQNTGVTISAYFQSFIAELIDSGRYANASDVIAEGLRLLEEREGLRSARLSELENAIEKGVASGASALADMNAVKAEARRRFDAARGDDR